MNEALKTFIKSKLPKQYTKLHNVLDIINISENSVELESQFFYGGSALNATNRVGIDKVEVIGIQQLVRDYKLQMLLK